MDSSRDESTSGFQMSRILSRESSAGHSSRIYYYRIRAEGVPFQWERQPGTPKNPPKEDVNIPPLSPPPSFQSLGLPKTCFHDDDEQQESKTLKVWLSKKIKKFHPLKSFGKSRQNSHGSLDRVVESDGEFVASSFKNSSSSSSSSSTDSFASNNKESEKSARDMMEDPYCCNLALMDKEETNREMHKRGFSQESVKTFFLSRMSSVDQSYYRSKEGIPFKWEMQPGTPIHTPQNEVIPPPSPPPMVQSLALPKPCIPHDHQEEAKKSRSTWERIKRMIKTTHEQKEFRVSNELSFRLQQRSHHHGNSVLTSSSSSSSSSSISKKKVLPYSKFRRDVLGWEFCFNPWKIKANLAAAASRRI